jgi:hypothetical protein
VSRQDLYLNRSTVKSGLLLPTIFEGTPLDFSDLNLKLEPRQFFGSESIECEEVVRVSFDGVVPEAMCKLPPIEVPYSNQVEVLSDGLTPEAMVGRFRSDDAEWYTCHPSALEDMVKIDEAGIAEREKDNTEELECLKIRPIAPEAMMKFYIEKDLNDP